MALDTQAAAEFVYLQAERAGNANVYPIGAITKGRQGVELAEIGGLVDGGAVAFTDDGAPVSSAEISSPIDASHFASPLSAGNAATLMTFA